MRFLVLVALAVGSNAIDVDMRYLTSLSDDLHNYVSSSLRSLLKDHGAPALPEPKTAETCQECVQGGAKFVIGKTVDKMKDMCAKMKTNNTDDPRSCMAMKMCGMMGKHPKVMLGMMMEHVRPMSLSTAYCVGKGSCEKPDSITMSEIATGSEPHAALLDNFDKIDWSDVEEQTEMLAQDSEMGENDAPKCEDAKKQMPVCPMCMKKAMRHVMGHAVMKVKGMCAHADDDNACPVMKKMCPWMAQNKEVSMGMLAAKVEPWKFAFGFCLHKAKSHHGKPHHGFLGAIAKKIETMAQKWHAHHGPQDVLV